MKAWFIILQCPLIISMAGHGCKPESGLPAPGQPVQVTMALDTTRMISFEQEILPLLQSRCSPCHFRGGKMYAKMPFDNPQTIRDHTEGVLKRFKEPERSKLKSYLESGSAP